MMPFAAVCLAVLCALGLGLAAGCLLRPRIAGQSKPAPVEPMLESVVEPLVESAAEPLPDPLPDPGPEPSPNPDEGRIIGLLAHRGGSGKSLLAVALADAWARNGQRVLLLETDSQAVLGARLGHVDAQPGAIAHLPLGFSHGLLPQDDKAVWLRQQRQDWDYVLIDTPLLGSGEALMPLLDAAALVMPLDASALISLDGASRLLAEGLSREHQIFLGVQFTRYRPEDALQSALWERLVTDHAGLLLAAPSPEEDSLARWSAGLCAWPIPAWQWLPAKAIQQRLSPESVRL